MHDFPAMDSDAKLATNRLLFSTHLVELRQRRLHVHGSQECVLMVISIALGASKHCKDRVAHVFVNRSFVSE